MFPWWQLLPSRRQGGGHLAVLVSPGRAAADRIVVLPGSGVYKSLDGPARLAFDHLPPIRDLPTGSWTRLPIDLVNRGDRAARGIDIGVTPGSGLRVKPKSVGIGVIGPHRRAHSGLWIEPRRAGRYKLVLAAHSSANSPGVEVSMLAAGGDPRADNTLRGLAIATAVLCAAGLLVLRRWPAPG
jgi:hypothetical protein